MTDAMDVLDPGAAVVEYRGERLEIQPLTIGQLPKLVRMAKPLIDALLATDDLEALTSAAGGAGVDDDGLELLLALVGDHGDTVYEAAAHCVARPAEWVARGDVAEFVALAAAIVRVNRDFFTRRLAPLLASRPAAVASGGGKTASSS